MCYGCFTRYDRQPVRVAAPEALPLPRVLHKTSSEDRWTNGRPDPDKNEALGARG